MALLDTALLIFLLAISGAILLALCIIDLRRYQLPDTLNAAFGGLGLAFHLLSPYGFLPPASLGIAALLSAGLFLGLRWLFWKYRHVEALGLGDVKFIAAASFWVGLNGIFWVIALGALSTICAAPLYRLRGRPPSKRSTVSLRVPFGPGLTVATAGVFTHMIARSI
ncbi:prepilin peptidase [Ferrovibrio sp.]|uniref:prepilin peptidase n=1 Tax=Ferrovibrio sp. TaxID=1917215 RepID=UPI003D11B9F2